MAKSAAALATAFVSKDTQEVKKPVLVNSFRGMFGEAKLSEQEEKRIQLILNEHTDPEAIQEEQVVRDFETLSKLTSEIKAINNQSMLLHGERIKKAQELLRSYKDGAFSDWLMATYGNRQTPYNMLQYYEFYHAVPEQVRPKVESMPKKAVCALASREGSFDRKLDIVQNYQGEGQRDVVSLIQKTFPVSAGDKRKRSYNEVIINNIERLVVELEEQQTPFSEEDKTRLMDLSNRLIAAMGKKA